MEKKVELTQEQVDKLYDVICRAGTALHGIEETDPFDPIMQKILRDAARKAIDEGLDVFGEIPLRSQMEAEAA